MPSVHQELNHFAEFARSRLAAGGSRLTLDELFDLWRIENPGEDAHAENVTAINASIRDFQNGERGTVAGEDSALLRREFGIIDE